MLLLAVGNGLIVVNDPELRASIMKGDEFNRTPDMETNDLKID